MRRAAKVDAPYLGTLCKRWHDHECSGKSMRHASGHCAACFRLRSLERMKDPAKRGHEEKMRLQKQERRRVASNRTPKGPPMTLERRREIGRTSKAGARRKNPEEVRKAARDHYERNKIAICIRNRVFRAIKQKKAKKIQAVMGYGIDVHAIAAHLGLCPGRHGDWHIDHIRPLAWFDMSDPRQVMEAFSPENHQWLPALENIIKGARRHG